MNSPEPSRASKPRRSSRGSSSSRGARAGGVQRFTSSIHSRLSGFSMRRTQRPESCSWIRATSARRSAAAAGVGA